MPLETVPGTPGLWRDTQWKPEMPGLYGLIVGASYYPHLEDGDPAAPAKDNFGMGQLVASAKTAANMFEWLRGSFRRKEMPVVWCQLLLSPTAAEKAYLDSRGLTHYAEPTNTNLRTAIDRWTGNVPTTPSAVGRSRTLFFFSGHGVQTNWHPLLLPSDYLDPGLGSAKLENCISVGELLTWIERNSVAEHLALIDACRNEFSPLASKGATANTSFPVAAPGSRSPRTAASLASTSPNAVAYQLPGWDNTFFGHAVLEALRNGVAGGNDAHLEFRELVDYVKPRVNALLQQVQPGTTLDQTARQRIDGDDTMVVTEFAPGGPAFGAPAPLTRGGARRSASRAPTRSQAPATAQVMKATAERFDDAFTVDDPIALEAMRQDFGQIHRRFGHEYASHPWRDGMALYALYDGQRIDQGGAIVQAVQRNRDSSLVQVDLSLSPRHGGVLLVFEGAQYVQRERLAVALPTDLGGNVPIRLNLTLGPDASAQSRIFKIEARLGPSTQNAHYRYLWDLTREADLGSLNQVAATADLARLEQAAQDKVNGQVAATAGMLLLARAGRIDLAHDWTRNLMQWYPDIPDGAVLWAESLRHASAQGAISPFGVEHVADEMANALDAIGKRGVPFFSDSVELADRLLRDLLRQPAFSSNERFAQARQRLQQVFDVGMPSGHFIALAGLPRPGWMNQGSGALSVEEMLSLLGRRIATQVVGVSR